MDSDRTIRNPHLQIVEEHLTKGDPPDTRAAIDALVAKGHPPGHAKQLVANVVKAEMEAMIKGMRAFDKKKYAADLQKMLAAEM